MRIRMLLILCLFTTIGYTQNNTDIFQRITAGVKDYKLDTTAAPDDKITRKIIELRTVKGGFNINEVISFKIEEDRQKKDISDEEATKVAAFFQTGNGKKWLDNAVIWIYRRLFTYDELKQLVKFYKTSAGRKMSEELPVIMLQSLRASELIKEVYVKQNAPK